MIQTGASNHRYFLGTMDNTGSDNTGSKKLDLLICVSLFKRKPDLFEPGLSEPVLSIVPTNIVCMPRSVWIS